MIDTCERCDGVGCRYCSGRGWVRKEQALDVPTLIETVIDLGLPVVVFDDEPSEPTTGEPSSSPTGTDDGKVERSEPKLHGPLHCAVEGHFDDEPDEQVTITTQYPKHRVKLLQTRYGTLSRALAEVFNGRPWRGQS